MRTLFSAAARQSNSWRGGSKLTVDSEIPEGGTGGSLYLNVWTLEKEQDWLQGIAIDFPDI